MEVPFTNHQVTVDHLPSVETLNLSGLHRDYVAAKMIGNILFWIIIALIGGSILFFTSSEWPSYLRIGAPILFITIMLTNILITYLGLKRKKYALRERDILYQTGLLWRQKTVIPFNRIQHAEVTQGPIQRMFDLGVLRIFTAGGSASDMNIPGLHYIKAQNLKEYILGKTSSDEEE